MSDRRMLDGPVDAAKERRLDHIRREAEGTGPVIAPGVRPVGAPFPLGRALPEASAEAGYYGLPLVKHPPWIWSIPAYFFVGGMAGGAALIATAAAGARRSTTLARDARIIAAVGGALSPPLLIYDLGRPARFLNMLRVIKPQSPMSVGVWTLVAFSATTDTALAADYLAANPGASRLVRRAARITGGAAGVLSALVGTVLSTYSGVLIGVSAIPVWARNIHLLPFHFGMSGLASAAALLELKHDQPGLHRTGMATAAAETFVGAAIEARSARALEPLKRGRSGRLIRLGGLLSGPVPLALRAFGGHHRATCAAAAVSLLTGSILTRIGWMAAGRASAEDPRDAVGLP